MNAIKRNCVLILALLIVGTICKAQITILVSKGPFTSVEQAAISEERVNWSDNDLVDDRACTESFAAMELAKYLPVATAIKAEEVNFSDSGKMPINGDVFVVGSRFSNSLINKYPLSREDTKLETEQSFSIRSFKEDNMVITIIEGADRIGTLYGVYRYLEELGIKFIGLGEKGKIFPDTLVDIPFNLNIIENPSYFTRGFYAWGDRKVDDDFFFWMARNKLNYWTAENQPVYLLKKLGFKLSEGGHIIQGIVFVSDDEYPYNHPKFKGDENKPDDPYKIADEYLGDVDGDGKLSNFEAHPEWYGMKDGERVKIESEDRHGFNFCTTNEDARKEFAKRIVQQLADGVWQHADIFNFMAMDGAHKWCQCENCKSYDGSYTDKMFLVTHDILKELAKASGEGKLNHRVEVNNIAYVQTLAPPTKPLPEDYDYKNSSVTFYPIRRCYAHSFADPACSEINQWQMEAYQSWTIGGNRHYTGSMLIGEYYNVSSIKSLPVVFTRIMSTDIPWYWRNGARHFHYMHSPHKLWGTWTLNQYLMAKLLWDTGADANNIVDNYFSLYYPTTSFTSRQFYEQLEFATANIKPLVHAAGIEHLNNYSIARNLLTKNIFDLDHIKYKQHKPLVNDGPDIVEMMDAMEQAKKHIEQSLIDCNDTIELLRLLEDQKRFEYGYVMYKYIFYMIRTSVFHVRNDREMASREFAIAEEYAEELRNMVDVVQVSSDHANAPNGFEAARGFVSVFKKFKKLYSQ